MDLKSILLIVDSICEAIQKEVTAAPSSSRRKQ